MSRRAMLLAGVALGLAACQTPASYTHERPGRAEQNAPGTVQIIYVSADDCPWCQRWAREEGQAFDRSPLRQRVVYSQINFSSFRSYRTREAWPEAQRGIYDQLVAANSNFVSPHFILLRDGRVIEWGGGTYSWQRKIMPALTATLT